MELQGRVKKLLPIQSDTSANGNEWKRQDFLFEFFEFAEQIYPSTIVLSIMNDRIDDAGLKEGDEIKVKIALGSHFYNGRHYNDIRTGQITILKRAGASQPADAVPNAAQPHPSPVHPMSVVNGKPVEKKDDLPF